MFWIIFIIDFLFKHTTNSVFETSIKLNVCLILVTLVNLR